MKRKLLILGLTWTVVAAVAVAAELPRPTGLTVSPAFQQIDIRQGETASQQSIAVSNNETVPVTYELTVIDMGSLDETGGVIFSGLPADYAAKYGLANWLRLDSRQITVAAGSTAAVGFRIINDENLAPGGHYGAVVVRPVQDIQPAPNQIKFDPQAASLLFVRKVGGESFRLSLEPPKVSTAWWRLPNELSLLFSNQGNVHVVPRGTVRVVEPGGRVVARTALNQESSLILPERNRRFTDKIETGGFWRRPGKYKLAVSYRIDGQSDSQLQEVSFMFWNSPLLALLSSILLSVGLAFVKFRRQFLWLIKKLVQAVTNSRKKLMRSK